MAKKLTSKRYADVATGVRLSSHEKLCAERMNNILKSIERLVSTGKGIVRVLVVLGSLAAAFIGYLNLK
jgi:hypothetical protein